MGLDALWDTKEYHVRHGYHIYMGDALREEKNVEKIREIHLKI
jgi:hypothetical protein